MAASCGARWRARDSPTFACPRARTNNPMILMTRIIDGNILAHYSQPGDDDPALTLHPKARSRYNMNLRTLSYLSFSLAPGGQLGVLP